MTAPDTWLLPPITVKWLDREGEWDREGAAKVNAYFGENPQHVLGVWTRDRLAHGRMAAGVRTPKGETRSLRERIEEVASRVHVPPTRTDEAAVSALAVLPEVRTGVPTEPSDGGVRRAGVRVGGVPEPAVPPVRAACLRLLATVRRLTDGPAEGRETARRACRAQLAALQRRWGRLGATGSKKGGGHSAFAEVCHEPWWPLLASLEGPTPGTWGALLRDGALATTSGGADAVLSPEDAVLAVLDEAGRLDMPTVAVRCGLPEDEARQALRGAVFREVGGDGVVEWQPRSRFLSGDVRERLRRCREMMAVDPSFSEEMGALEAVLPPAPAPEAIGATLGASWIPPEVVLAFLGHLFPRYDGYGASALYVEATAAWRLTVTSRAVLDSVECTDTYGTAYFDGVEILRHALALQVPIAYDELDDGMRVRNATETAAAQAKLCDVREKWAAWVWADKERAGALAAVYADRYVRFVRRGYAGVRLTVPGLTAEVGGRPFAPRPHQIAAAARIAERGDEDQGVLIPHKVGGGKTLSALMGACKRLLLGTSKKVCVVVPAHVVPEWVRMFREYFPGRADWLLTADSVHHHIMRQSDRIARATNPSQARRRALLARCAAPAGSDGAPKIVLLSYEQFKSIPVEPELAEAYLQREVDDLREALSDAEEGGEESRVVQRTLKRRETALEKARVVIRERWREATSGADVGGVVGWKALGFDMLICDEFQYAKNLGFNSKISGVAGLPRSESQRALDAAVKIHWLICPELFPGCKREGGDGRVVGLTGTPLTNTLAEAWVMTRLLQPRLLRRMGWWQFDAWAGTFTSPYVSVEMDAVGKFRSQQRLKFQNVPDLLDALAQAWEFCTDYTGEERPDLVGGKMEVVPTPGSEALRTYTQELATRAEAVRARAVPPEEDNMLKITHDGRVASLFNGPPLLGEDGHPCGWPDDRRTKLDALADRVWDLYCRGDRRRGTQLVFCDLGTPVAESGHVSETAEDRWREHGVYGAICDRLIARGVLRREVAFIHDADDAAERARLYADVRRGEVRVLVGSTQKMGTGVNVQERALAVHHVTVPWRPDWLEQADGRAKRPGNTWHAVHVVSYPTEGSFDVVLWQMIEAKSAMISQVASGAYAARECDDIGDMVLTAREVRAIALGDVRVIDKVRMEVELSGLARSCRSHREEARRGRWEIQSLPKEIADLSEEAEGCRRAAEVRDAHPLAPGAFACRLRTSAVQEVWQEVDDRATADRRVQVLCEGLRGIVARGEGEALLGTYRGFALVLEADRSGACLLARCPDGADVRVAYHELASCFTTLEFRLSELPARATRLRGALAQKRDRLEDLGRRSISAWPGRERAAALLAKYEALCCDLAQGGLTDRQHYEFSER